MQNWVAIAVIALLALAIFLVWIAEATANRNQKFSDFAMSGVMIFFALISMVVVFGCLVTLTKLPLSIAALISIPLGLGLLRILIWLGD